MLALSQIGGTNRIDRLPDTCPFCHKSVTPNPMTHHMGLNEFHVIYSCPNKDCVKVFVGYYTKSQKPTNQAGILFWDFVTISKGTITTREFSDTLSEISPGFVKIYNQALYAEQEGLLEICGVGYRKALEFLIKDYSIKNHPTEQQNIEQKMLAACISQYVTDDRIKDVARRAVWLGNDETHYVRKWEGKNLNDMKKLIELTIHWIEAEVLTQSIIIDMPE